MLGFEITGPYASAMLMSLGALCVFIWGVLSGAFHGADEASPSDSTRRRWKVTETTPGKPTSDETRALARGGGVSAAATSRRDTDTSRSGCWSSTPCCSLWGLYYAYDYWGGLGPGRI